MSDCTTPLKRCRKCGKDYPTTDEYFNRSRGNLVSPCKPCIRIAALARHYANRDRNLAHMKHRYDNDINGEKARVRANSARYRKEHPDRVHAAKIVSMRKKPELYKKLGQNWRHNNPDKVKVISHNRMARKRNLPDLFTAEQWQACLSYWHNCCAYCGAQQGFWNPITADHFIPLSSPDCPGTVVGNMLPCCKSCNSSKQDKDARAWLRATRRDASAVLAEISVYFATL